MSTPAQAAALYAGKLGFRVVPIHDVSKGVCSCKDGAACKSAGKHPRLYAWQEEATNDPDTVAEWFTQWPAANVGIATGEGSGFFVLDVDPDHGGAETLAALLEQHGPLPETAQARTGSGGTHYLFKLVAGLTFRNSASKLGPGLDTRGDGGQIVVAPSVSSKGVYRWVNGPWRVPIAAAPEWLIEKLQAPLEQPSRIPGLSATDRGWFPPASPAVLAAAAEALELHGPAVDGQGGGLHTVHAAAILTHDYALTDAEAWPLFVEWNATCSPPWALEGRDSLREKFDRGRKYGKAEYGVRRGSDAVELAQKLTLDWQNGGAHQDQMWDLINRCRHLARICGDSAKKGVIERDLKGATGLGARELALPKAQSVDADAPTPEGAIEVTTRLHEVADHATKAIAAAVFQRNGVLCQVVKAERTFIHDLQATGIQDLMSQGAKFVRTDKEGVTPQAAPLQVAAILAARRTHADVRILEAVTSAPVFLADGSILQERGYNAAARVFLEPSVTVDVPKSPTWEDAVSAVDRFRELLSDFQFAAPADFATWLAALLSPLVKSATGNAPSPLICVSASSPGAGKTLLTDVLARIITGAGAEVRPYNPKDPGEWGKRLTAFVKAASPVSVFDNCNGPIGDEGLDRLITSPSWSDRILGASDAPALPNVTTWMATGNNIEPIGDTVRRVLMCRIEVNMERPQERTGFAHPMLVDYALENRSLFLGAALTILRAFHVAGRPRQKLASWGSFGAWSDLVRNAVVWAGQPDPYLTQKRAAADLNEPENEAHDFWLGVIAAGDGYGPSICATAQQRNAREVLGLREDITVHGLRRFVARFVDKPRAGKRIRKTTDDRRNQTRYVIEAI